MRKHIFVYGKPVRLISVRRARKLQRQGVKTLWHGKYGSYVWFWEDLIERKNRYA